MTRSLSKPIAVSALLLALTCSVAKAETHVVEFDATDRVSALITCRMMAHNDGGNDRSAAVDSIDYFRWSCRYDLPAQREISVEVLPLLHDQQARLLCRDAARSRGGTWTGSWQSHGALRAGICTIRVSAE